MQILPKNLSIGLFFILSLLIVKKTFAQRDNIDPKKDTLLVGITGDEPFVMNSERDNGKSEGISIEIWNNLADQGGWEYKYKIFSTVDKAINALEEGRIDLIAGPLSITSNRLERIAFSQPYYQSSLSIASMEVDSLWGYIKPLFSTKLLFAVIGFLFILGIVGVLFWLAERKKNPDEFSGSPVEGIGNGMWLAIVTMSTVGYGDLAPKSVVGRIVAGSWIVITIIFATSMIAGIATVLTSAGDAPKVTNVEDIPGRKIATVKAAPAADFIKDNHGKAIEADNLNEAFKLLKDGKVDAIVFDRPQLQYYIRKHPDEEYFLPHAEYNKQGYGFAFPLKSEFTYEVNLELLDLAEHNKIAEIVDFYLGNDKTD